MRPFVVALDFVLSREGGWVSDPVDPGGETNLGITHETLKAAIFLGLVPATVTVRTLTRDDASAIYEVLYWRKAACDQLPPALGFLVMDCAVNQGVTAAVRLLQRSLGIAEDGIVGGATLASIPTKLGRGLLNEFTSRRLKRYAGTANADRFLAGWINRAVDAHSRALAILWNLQEVA